MLILHLKEENIPYLWKFAQNIKNINEGTQFFTPPGLAPKFPSRNSSTASANEGLENELTRGPLLDLAKCIS